MTKTIEYMNLGGSAIKTIVHIRENGRVIIMICASESQPEIYGYHSSGEILFPGDSRFDDIESKFDRTTLGTLAPFIVHVERISDSCGFGVPLYTYPGQRPTFPDDIKRMGVVSFGAYLQAINNSSIDGLPGISPVKAHIFEGLKPDDELQLAPC